MSAQVLVTHSAEATQALGRRLGARLEAGDLIMLHGELGSGKTTLTQGIAWGAGVTGYAHSPTFVLVHEYAGRFPLYHVDLYRIDGGSLEVQDLGIDEMLERGACVVEWAERAAEVFPTGHLAVRLVLGDRPDDRTITIEASGERHVALLDALASDVAAAAAGG